MLCRRTTCGYPATWVTRATRFRRIYLCDVHAAQLGDSEDLLDPIEAVMTEAQRRTHVRETEGEVA